MFVRRHFASVNLRARSSFPILHFYRIVLPILTAISTSRRFQCGKKGKNRNALMGLTLNTMIVFSVKYLLPLTHDYSRNDSILLLVSRLPSASDSPVRQGYIVNENVMNSRPSMEVLFHLLLRWLPTQWNTDLEALVRRCEVNLRSIMQIIGYISPFTHTHIARGWATHKRDAECTIWIHETKCWDFIRNCFRLVVRLNEHRAPKQTLATDSKTVNMQYAVCTW